LAGRFYASRSDRKNYVKIAAVNAGLKYGKMEVLDSGLLQAANTNKYFIITEELWECIKIFLAM
jgi:hypothetical protein